MKLPNSMFIELGRKQAILFNDPKQSNANEVYIDCLVTCYSIRDLMVSSYKALVAYRALIPIEWMRDEEKNTLWESAKEFSKGRLDKKSGQDLCMALYALEFYLNETV